MNKPQQYLQLTEELLNLDINDEINENKINDKLHDLWYSMTEQEQKDLKLLLDQFENK